MPETSDFLKTEADKGSQQSTATPRDFLNKIYINRYEDVIQTLKVGGPDPLPFREAMFKLYWDFVIPRAYALNKDEKKVLDFEKVLEDRNDKASLDLLRKIAELLHKKGFIKTERDEVDPDHAFMEEKTVIPG